MENVLERAILYSGNNPVLELKHFSLEIDSIKSSDKDEELELTSISNMEKSMIYNALKRTNNNRTLAAKILGISARTLRNKLHQYEDEDPNSLPEFTNHS